MVLSGVPSLLGLGFRATPVLDGLKPGLQLKQLAQLLGFQGLTQCQHRIFHEAIVLACDGGTTAEDKHAGIKELMTKDCSHSCWDPTR